MNIRIICRYDVGIDRMYHAMSSEYVVNLEGGIYVSRPKMTGNKSVYKLLAVAVPRDLFAALITRCSNVSSERPLQPYEKVIMN